MTSLPKIGTAMTIDDEKIDQILYKRIMERSGLVDNVIAFRMAEDALDYLKSPDREPVDVIFLDINMPRMNGFEFLDQATSELGDSFVDCVVIMLTTSLDPEDEKRARCFSVVKEYLAKPLSLCFRLFGNMLGEETLLAVFMGIGVGMLAFSHLPVGVPMHVPFIFLALLTTFIQALVFTVLSTIYFAMALPHPKGEH